MLGELLPEVQAQLVPQLEANLASWKAVEAEEEAAAAAAVANTVCPVVTVAVLQPSGPVAARPAPSVTPPPASDPDAGLNPPAGDAGLKPAGDAGQTLAAVGDGGRPDMADRWRSTEEAEAAAAPGAPAPSPAAGGGRPRAPP